MTISKARQKLVNSPIIVAQRKRIEQELEAIPKIDSRLRLLMTEEGFVDYFHRMACLYPSRGDAYETLEGYYEATTGHRKYADYKSFARALQRLHSR